VVGSRFWPTYALRSLSLAACVAGVTALLGGLVQINPVWLYGPADPAAVTTAAQPDWYLGWLEGALRLTPQVGLAPFGYRMPEVVLPGVLLPAVLIGLLYLVPFLDRRLTGDTAEHHLLQRPPVVGPIDLRLHVGGQVVQALAVERRAPEAGHGEGAGPHGVAEHLGAGRADVGCDLAGEGAAVPAPAVARGALLPPDLTSGGDVAPLGLDPRDGRTQPHHAVAQARGVLDQGDDGGAVVGGLLAADRVVGLVDGHPSGPQHVVEAGPSRARQVGAPSRASALVAVAHGAVAEPDRGGLLLRHRPRPAAVDGSGVGARPTRLGHPDRGRRDHRHGDGK
jgi:hypothetical protein